jgi:ribosomal protein L28
MEGRAMNLKLCTKCIRLFKKAAQAVKEQKEATSTTPVASV